MKKLPALIIMMVLMFASIPLSAQNYLLKNNQNGVHLKGIYSKDTYEIREFDIESGFTFKGWLTLNTFCRRLIIPGLTSSEINFVGGGLDFLIAKQSTFPVSISVGGTYDYSKYQINAMDETYNEPEYAQLHDIIFTTNVSRRFDVSSELSIIPSTTLAAFNRIFKFPSGYRTAQTSNPDYYLFTLKSDVVYKFIDVFAGVDFMISNIWNPWNLSYYNFKIGIGMLFKTNQHKQELS